MSDNDGHVCCPNCGEDLAVVVRAELPAATDLTVSLKVEPGQLMRLDTMAGVMSSWRDLQIAVGASMGAETEVYLADMGQRDNEFWFTGRITNRDRDAGCAGDPQGLHSEGAAARPEGVAQNQSEHSS